MELGDADELARLRRKLDTLWAKDITKRYNFGYGNFISNFCNTFLLHSDSLPSPIIRYHSLPSPTFLSASPFFPSALLASPFLHFPFVQSRFLPFPILSCPLLSYPPPVPSLNPSFLFTSPLLSSSVIRTPILAFPFILTLSFLPRSLPSPSFPLLASPLQHSPL